MTRIEKLAEARRLVTCKRVSERRLSIAAMVRGKGR